MPIFEFRCAGCRRDFEELVINSREKIVCPDCGGDKCEKLMSAASFRSKASDGAVVSGSAGGGCTGCAATSCAGCGH